ncbi:hypothetical protein QA612_09805 [Evansella sp. AB-P1]|nr:hypothetical protein [Evansella sp. AB-P1]MDG5787794.1 hypothetical protein [Evansella sp. AB-P1]
MNDLEVLEQEIKDVIADEIEQNPQIEDLKRLNINLYKVIKSKHALQGY